MNYSVYLFDFDYTLVDSAAGIVGCFHRTIAQYHLPPVPDERLCRTIGLPMEDAVKQVTGLQSNEQIDAFIETYRRFADQYMTPNTHFFPETLPMLRSLRQNGAHTAIISTKTRSRIAEKFQPEDARGLIDFIIGREDVSQPKPAPEGILCAIARFAVPKEAVLYIGDSLMDAGAAQNAGTDFAAVTTGTTSPQEFQSFPHVKIMKSLAELID